MAAQPNLRAVARRKARKYGLDPGVFVRQIQQESGFNPNAQSPAGARGIAQIMPATAKGWGVNPMNPVAALDAAAKNMASYVRKYGSYENALRAYNAGPGAIRASRNYAETNNYVRTILRGGEPSRTPGPRGGGAGSRQNALLEAARRGVPQGSEGILGLLEQLGQRAPAQSAGVAPPAHSAQAAMPEGAQIPVSGGGPSPAPDVSALMDAIRTVGGDIDVPGLNVAPGGAPGRSGGNRGGPGGGGGGRQPGTLAEMFYDRGINMDEGRRVAPIGDHGSHVHAGFDSPQALMQAARLAQRMGLAVRENPKFDPVDPVHTEGSLHYQRFRGRPGIGRAIDVSGGTPRKLARFNRRVARRFG